MLSASKPKQKVVTLVVALMAWLAAWAGSRPAGAVELNPKALVRNEELLLRGVDGTQVEARFVETRGDTLVLRRGPEVLATTARKLDRVWVRRKNPWTSAAAGAAIGFLGGGLLRSSQGGDCPDCPAEVSDVLGAAALEGLADGAFGFLVGLIGGSWAPFAPRVEDGGSPGRGPYPPWEISARGAATWGYDNSWRRRMVDEDDGRGHVGGRLSGWKKTSREQLWGLEYETLGRRRFSASYSTSSFRADSAGYAYLPAQGVDDVRTSQVYAGLAWRWASTRAKVAPFGTLGVGSYIQRRAIRTVVTDSLGVAFDRTRTETETRVGPTAGLGLRFGTGPVRPAIEVRGHLALGDGVGRGVRVEAGVDFD